MDGRVRFKHVSVCIVWTVFSLVESASVALAEIRRAQPHILILNSYHPERASVRDFMTVMYREFSGAHRLQVEFLDAKRHDMKVQKVLMDDLLGEKLALTGPPDLVIASDDAAAQYAADRRDDLLGGAPLVFAAVNSYNRVVELSALDGVTGVFEKGSVPETLRLAQQLSPVPLRRVFFTYNESMTSQARTSDVLRVRSEFPDLVFRFVSLSELTFDQAAALMAREVGPDAIAMPLASFRDKEGRTVDHEHLGRFFADRVGVPQYAHVSQGVESGAVGGHVVSISEQAEAAARLAKQMLAAPAAPAPPPVLTSPNVSVVNEQAAARYGLRLDRLGADVRIVNPAPTFWRRYDQAIIAGSVVLSAMLAVLIGVLVVSRRSKRRLKHANELLAARNQEMAIVKQYTEHQSLHDELTGLPNRRYLERVMEEYAGVSDVCGEATQLALLHVDLDHFKQINDTLGHAAGDHVLQVVAQRLRRIQPDCAFCARVGGDEFLMLTCFEQEADMAQFATDLVADVGRPVEFEGRVCRFGASVGVALANGDVDPNLLTKNADVALYRAKRSGRGTFDIYSMSDQVRTAQRKALGEDVVRAIEADEFEPFFQPELDPASREIVAVEALVRWRRPERGVVEPAAFLTAAEEAGAVAQIDRLVLAKAADALAHWRALGLVVPRLSVNISTARLHAPELLADLARRDFGQTRLSLELAEETLDGGDEAQTRWLLDQLAEAGATITLDNFGEGRASIANLMRVNPDRLKIARYLAARIESDPVQLATARALIQVGKSLGLPVIAGGVDHESQIRLLRDLGVDALQGVALCAPKSKDEMTTFLLAQRLSAAKIGA